MAEPTSPTLASTIRTLLRRSPTTPSLLR